jgi:hypothetical protein
MVELSSARVDCRNLKSSRPHDDEDYRQESDGQDHCQRGCHGIEDYPATVRTPPSLGWNVGLAGWTGLGHDGELDSNERVWDAIAPLRLRSPSVSERC